MRILVVKPILPWPPNQGTKRVTVALLKALAGHEVTLAAPLLSRSEEEAARDLERTTGCRVVTALAPNRRSFLHRAWYKAFYLVRSLVGQDPPRALYSSPPDLIRTARKLSTQQPFDLAIFEYWYTYPWFRNIAAERKVLLAHDAEFSVNRLAAGRGAAGTGRGRWQKIEQRREREACRSVDQVWTLTDADAEALASLSEMPRGHFVTMPYGVDTETLDLEPPGSGEEVLFFGAFLADFNQDALHYLLEAIWPHVVARRPAARLLVAGGALPASLEEKVRSKGGRYLGSVDDVRLLYRQANVVVIPLRFGGGLRIRLLEALACSRAVVATPVAVAGMAGQAGEHYQVAADPLQFASAIVDLLASPEAARRLGSAGRELVRRLYSEDTASAAIRRMAETVPVTLPGRSEHV